MASPLITADELAALLQGDNEVLVLDASYVMTDPDAGRGLHEAGHIPGAVFVDVDQVFSAPVDPTGRGGRHPLPAPDDLQGALREHGVRSGVPVVVYDQGPSMGSARAWWVLRDAGLDDVRVLDGGFAAWQAAGLPTTTEATEATPGDVMVRPGSMYTVDADRIPGHVAEGHRVVDVRTGLRFRGESERIDPVAGHIPGSENLPAGELQRDGRFLPADELRTLFEGLGEGDVFSCGSGITAANALLAAEHAGLTGLGLYPGSWSDWISDPQRPVATGE